MRTPISWCVGPPHRQSRHTGRFPSAAVRAGKGFQQHGIENAAWPTSGKILFHGFDVVDRQIRVHGRNHIAHRRSNAVWIAAGSQAHRHATRNSVACEECNIPADLPRPACGSLTLPTIPTISLGCGLPDLAAPGVMCLPMGFSLGKYRGQKPHSR